MHRSEHCASQQLQREANCTLKLLVRMLSRVTSASSSLQRMLYMSESSWTLDIFRKSTPALLFHWSVSALADTSCSDSTVHWHYLSRSLMQGGAQLMPIICAAASHL